MSNQFIIFIIVLGAIAVFLIAIFVLFPDLLNTPLGKIFFVIVIAYLIGLFVGILKYIFIDRKISGKGITTPLLSAPSPPSVQSVQSAPSIQSILSALSTQSALSPSEYESIVKRLLQVSSKETPECIRYSLFKNIGVNTCASVAFFGFLSDMSDLFSIDAWHIAESLGIKRYDEYIKSEEDFIEESLNYMERLLEKRELLYLYSVTGSNYEMALKILDSIAPVKRSSKFFVLSEFGLNLVIFDSIKYLLPSYKADINKLEKYKNVVFSNLFELIRIYLDRNITCYVEINDIMRTFFEFFNKLDPARNIVYFYETYGEIFYERTTGDKIIFKTYKVGDKNDKGEVINLNEHFQKRKNKNEKYLIVPFTQPENESSKPPNQREHYIKLKSDLRYFIIENYLIKSFIVFVNYDHYITYSIRRKYGEVCIIDSLRNEARVIKLKENRRGELEIDDKKYKNHEKTTVLIRYILYKKKKYGLINQEKLKDSSLLSIKESSGVTDIKQLLNLVITKISEFHGNIKNIIKNTSKFSDILKKFVITGISSINVKKLFLILKFVIWSMEKMESYNLIAELGTQIIKGKEINIPPFLVNMLTEFKDLSVRLPESKLPDNLSDNEVANKLKYLYIDNTFFEVDGLVRDFVKLMSFFVLTLNSAKTEIENYDFIIGHIYLVTELHHLYSRYWILLSNFDKEEELKKDLIVVAKSFARIVYLKSYFRSFSDDSIKEEKLEPIATNIEVKLKEIINEQNKKIKDVILQSTNENKKKFDEQVVTPLRQLKEDDLVTFKNFTDEKIRNIAIMIPRNIEKYPSGLDEKKAEEKLKSYQGEKAGIFQKSYGIISEFLKILQDKDLKAISDDLYKKLTSKNDDDDDKIVDIIGDVVKKENSKILQYFNKIKDLGQDELKKIPVYENLAELFLQEEYNIDQQYPDYELFKKVYQITEKNMNNLDFIESSGGNIDKILSLKNYIMNIPQDDKEKLNKINNLLNENKSVEGKLKSLSAAGLNSREDLEKYIRIIESGNQ